MILADASAITAMVTREPEAGYAIGGDGDCRPRRDNPDAIYQAVLGLSRKRQWSVAEAEEHVGDFLGPPRVVIQPIRPETVHVALNAFAHYGTGRGHPAGLNLGDCFIYAHAKAAGAPLLYKGADFSKTDIESAA